MVQSSRDYGYSREPRLELIVENANYVKISQFFTK